ncbi:MAG: TetR/AcrR family transcriptional regulator [Proteobacteria bacterium]|nr:TetR/AcrR family transcriptional regulator [Pseudomonadota bacterium]
MRPINTRTLLLNEAEKLLRTQGYAAFSYADLAAKVKIRKASIHHHFPTKEDLGVAVIDAYLEEFAHELDRLTNSSADTPTKLLAYGDFFSASLRDGMMPLCGALAADAVELPSSMQRRVKRFFQLHLEWLQLTLSEGIRARELKSEPSASRSALTLLSTLQGASIVAWALKDASNVKATYKQVLETIIR